MPGWYHGFMEVFDFRKAYKALYTPKPAKPEIISAPRLRFMTLAGSGDPNEQAFTDAVGALYSLIFGIKFNRKRLGKAPDFTTGPLEGLWWCDDQSCSYTQRDTWRWKLLLWLPDFINDDEFHEYLAALQAKKANKLFDYVRVENVEEGLCAQVMHVGPYSTERKTIDLLQDFITKNGYMISGKHHEIYLGDPRRAAPERLKTIIRYPISK
jgi:hypothetical protein